MSAPAFRLLPSSGYKRDVKKLVKRNKKLFSVVKELQKNLGLDPHNLTNAYDIIKLTDVKPGDGQYRIRAGDYRIRYDIIGNDVVLHSFTDRKDTYQ
jgi:mRNA-degrading endonuclease RelE of RelBE toxin-antitoxin system